MTDPLPVIPVPFAGHVANVTGDRSIEIVASPPGPPRRIDGYSVGVVPVDTGAGPHDGEMHPDGDEFLHAVSGTMEVLVDDGDEHSIGTVTTVLLQRGDACVVPRASGTGWSRSSPDCCSTSRPDRTVRHGCATAADQPRAAIGTTCATAAG